MLAPRWKSEHEPAGLGRASAALVLAGAWALFFLPHLASSGVPYYRDNLLTYLPIKAYLHDQLRQGRWPGWYPWESLGMPFVGQVVTATFHPHTLLSFVFAAPVALKIELLAAYLWGAAGAYRMARAWPCSRVASLAAAWSLAFCGYALGMSNNLPYLLGITTLPWVAWAALRAAADPSPRRAPPLALAAALVFLGGDAQACLGSVVLVLAALPRATRKLRFLAMAAIAGGLCALLVCAELLPSLAVTPETLRGVGRPSPTMGLSFALHPRRLLGLVVADLVPDEVRYRVVDQILGGGTQLWSSSIFLGAVALSLVLTALWLRARGVWAWSAVAAGFVWIALGDRGGLLRVAWHVLPLLSRFRYPAKYFAPACIALAMLVALGLDAAIRRPRVAARIALAAAFALGLLWAAIPRLDVVGAVWRSAGSALQADDPVRTAVQRAWTLGAGAAALFAAAAAVAWLATARRPRTVLAVPLLLFAELWAGNGDQFPLVSADALRLPAPFAEAVRADAGTPPPRVVAAARPAISSTVTLGDGERWVAAMRNLLRPDVSALEGIGSFGWNMPGTTVRSDLVLGFREEGAQQLGGRFGACHRVVDTRERPQAGDVPLLRSDAFGMVLVRQPCVPYARLAAALPVRDAVDARDRLLRGVPEDTVLWEGGPPLAAPSGSVRWVSWAPGALSLDVDAGAGAAALAVAEAFARGWTARIDGASAPLHATDGLMLGVLVPPGRHRVELSYATPRARAGVALSLLGLFACAVLAWRYRRLTPGPAPAPP